MAPFKNVNEAQEAYDKLSKDFQEKASMLEAANAAAVEAANTIDALNAEASEKAKTIKDLEKKNTGLTKSVKDLNDTLNSVRSEKGNSKENTFEHGNKEYRVVAKEFSWEGKVIKAEELCDDEDLQEELLTAGVGFIEEIQD